MGERGAGEDGSLSHLRLSQAMNDMFSPETKGTYLNNYPALKILNSKKIALQLLLGDSSIQTMPQWVAFSTTTFCNLKCPHCDTHGTEEARAIFNSQRWDLDLTLKIAAETLPTAEGFCLTLSGEPLATPNFMGLIAKLRPYGAKMHLTTNGSLMSKKALIQLLPIVSSIEISIDGGTKDVVEAIRSGIEFKKLVNRVRVLTRSCELLRDVVNFPVRFAFTVMGSNIRDMPEAVRLARALGVEGIDFFPLQIFDLSIADEAVDFYLPLYKAYYRRTFKEAIKLKNSIDVNFLLPRFPGVSPDPNFSVEGKNRLVNLPADYYETLPPPESYLDLQAIEKEAAEIAESVRAEILPPSSSRQANGFAEFSKGYEKQLGELSRGANADIPWCGELDTRIFINPNGDATPCCMPGRPTFGNIHKETVTQIWNGPQRADFWQRFHSSLPPDCCKNCRNSTFVSRRSLLRQVMPETIAARFLSSLGLPRLIRYLRSIRLLRTLRFLRSLRQH